MGTRALMATPSTSVWGGPVSEGAAVRSFGPAECQFRYRESVFKEHKDWIILSVELAMTPASSAANYARPPMKSSKFALQSIPRP